MNEFMAIQFLKMVRANEKSIDFHRYASVTNSAVMSTQHINVVVDHRNYGDIKTLSISIFKNGGGFVFSSDQLEIFKTEKQFFCQIFGENYE